MPYYALDIETAPNPVVWELAQQAAQDRLENENKRSKLSDEGLMKEMVFHPLYGRVTAIGLREITEDEEAEPWQQVWCQDDEPGMLQELCKALKNNATIVTFNGLQFDIPFLNMRYRVHGFSPPSISTARYSFPPNSNHLDLFALVTDWAMSNRTKWLKLDLQTVAKLVGVFQKPPAGTLDSHEVPQAFQDGNFGAVIAHLEHDLAVTEAVARKLWLAPKAVRAEVTF